MQNNSTWARLRPSPPTWEADSWNASLTVLAFVGVVVLNIAPAIAYFGILIAVGATDTRHLSHLTSHDLLAAQFVTYVPLGIYLVAVIPALAHRSLRDLGVRAPSGSDVAVGLWGMVGMILAIDVTGGIIAAITHRHDTEQAVALLKGLHSPAEIALFVAIAVVLAPMIEELTFRVFLYNAISRYASFGVAAAWSSALFGVAHAASGPQLVTVSIPLAMGGFVLCWVYASTRCYWSNVIAHAAFNASNVALLFMFPNS